MAFIISNTDPDALNFACEQAKQQGWNPGLDDAATMINADQNGFFLGRIDNQPIACASAVCYDDTFAFFGFYIVIEAYRHQGYGIQVTHKRLDYVGDRCVGLDGVEENEHIYQKIGFKRAFISHRYQIKRIPKAEADLVLPFAPTHFDDLAAYDRLCFPAKRTEFLKNWLTAKHAETFCFYDKQQLKGYCSIRQCVDGYKIGPLFAGDNEIALTLITKAMHDKTTPVYIDVPSCNSAATKLIKQLDTETSFACVRMYRNGEAVFDHNKVFGLSSFELG